MNVLHAFDYTAVFNFLHKGKAWVWNNDEEYTYGGGAIGATTGAIIGAATGGAAIGAVIGGPVGAIGGYLIGDSLQAQGGSGGTSARQGPAKSSNCQVGG